MVCFRDRWTVELRFWFNQSLLKHMWEYFLFFWCFQFQSDMGVSKNRGTPKSSILIGLSIINHPFWGTPIFGNTHMHILLRNCSVSQLPKTSPFHGETVNFCLTPLERGGFALQDYGNEFESHPDTLQKTLENVLPFRLLICARV